MKKGIILAALLASGCAKVTDPMPAAEHSSGRVSVERIGVFVDTLAYGSKRGIYIVRDRETGAEFIGISGVGIAETHSVQSGKSSVTIEQ